MTIRIESDDSGFTEQLRSQLQQDIREAAAGKTPQRNGEDDNEES